MQSQHLLPVQKDQAITKGKQERKIKQTLNVGTAKNLDIQMPTAMLKVAAEKVKPHGEKRLIRDQMPLICMQLCGWCNEVKITTEMLGARSGV